MAEQTQGTGGTPEGQGGTPEAQEPTQPQSWADYLKAQPADVQGLYEADVKGLKTSLETERTQRKELSKQLTELSAKAEKGSELEQAINDMTARLSAAESRASFYEEASKPGIGCANPQLAYIAANEIGAIDAKGRVNWDVLKGQFPELFKTRAQGSADGGAGTRAQPPTGGMNAFIRRSAGR